MVRRRNYRIGIDVGVNSLGLAAVEYNENGMPVEILNTMVVAHDSGVDPESQRTGETRLAVSGVARRARRRLRARRKRLERVDSLLQREGWGVDQETGELRDVDSTSNDSFAPWRVRAELSNAYVNDEKERGEKLAIAIRHIARHRGWRNPYVKVNTLYARQPPSDALLRMQNYLAEKLQIEVDSQSTVGEVVALTGLEVGTKVRNKKDKKHNKEAPATNIRSSDKFEHAQARYEKTRAENPNAALFLERFMQSDLANEVLRICDVQRIDQSLTRKIIDEVFHSKSPRSSSKGRVGKDPLPGQQHLDRATTASTAFQEYRIAATLANLTIDGKPLSMEQRKTIFDVLAEFTDDAERLSWFDVADILHIERSQLGGVGKVARNSGNDDGSVSAKPPINVVYQRMMNCSITRVRTWWEIAPVALRDELVADLSNQAVEVEKYRDDIDSLYSELTEDERTKLEAMRLPSDRAAYSEDSLRRLTKRMQENAKNLHEARKYEFGVSNDWHPKADPIGHPVGNPAVDRVTKALARWLGAIEHEFGRPSSIYIEHVRQGLVSEKQKRELDREIKAREKSREKLAKSYLQDGGSEPNRSALKRYEAWKRQGGNCAYCLKHVPLNQMQMDHIVPQKGVGSNNTRANLVATCEVCNKSKTNRLMSEWIGSKGEGALDACIDAVKMWENVTNLPSKSWYNFKREVIDRMRRKQSDPEFDGRSIESVAWMARLVAERIRQHFQGSNELDASDELTKIFVFNGSITAAARYASGFVGRIPFIGGGNKKTRLDRRHHAMDAIVLTTLNYSVASTLAIRNNMRDTERLMQINIGQELKVKNADDIDELPVLETSLERMTWKEFVGNSDAAAKKFAAWRESAKAAADLVAAKVEADEVAVAWPLRLRLTNGSAHKDTISPFLRVKLRETMSTKLIDNASTPALWCALTRAHDFSETDGLPFDPSREIRVNGKTVGPDEEISFFQQFRGNQDPDDISDGAIQAAIAVRGGFAKIGNSIHHARIYRRTKVLKNGVRKSETVMIRVFSHDLLKHRDEDLFSVPLLPQSISVRCADPKVRKAFLNAELEYLGWISVGDELLLDMQTQTTGAIGDLLVKYPEVNRWRVFGMEAATKLGLKPVMLASEGFERSNEDGSEITLTAGEKMIDVKGKGWRPAVSVVFDKCQARVVRRDSLGNVRTSSRAHLPVSWSAN